MQQQELLFWRLLFSYIWLDPGHIQHFDRKVGGVFCCVRTTGDIITVCVRLWPCRLTAACRMRCSQRACCCVPRAPQLPLSRSCCVSLGLGTLGDLWASVCSNVATGWCMAAADLTAVAPCLRELRYNTLHDVWINFFLMIVVVVIDSWSFRKCVAWCS